MSSHRQRLRDTARILNEKRRLDAPARAALKQEKRMTRTVAKVATAGLHPKVPVQAITTVIVAALAYFGISLSPEVSTAVGVLVGFVAGYFAPAAPTVTRRKSTKGT